VIRRIAGAETRPLRHRVLRPGRRFEDTLFAGDDDPAAVHFGAFAGDDLVGTVSLYREPRPGTPAGGGRAWRLRGMATAPEARGQGHGRALLDACIGHVATSGGGELWCNARMPAAGFYGAAGFEVVGDEFEVDGIGPHVVMRLDVPSAG
jgi:predicted GNAT family N-acyltransferase